MRRVAIYALTAPGLELGLRLGKSLQSLLASPLVGPERGLATPTAGLEPPGGLARNKIVLAPDEKNLTQSGLTQNNLDQDNFDQDNFDQDKAPQIEVYGPRRLAAAFPDFQPFNRLGEILTANFAQYEGHVVIGAIGLTVRLLAPLLRDKRSDPAVVGLGQDGRFAVSLLSGHLGGANELALRVALATGGQAVITTATDLGEQPALEVLARDQGLLAQNWPNLAPLARALAEGEAIALHDPHNFFRPALKPWPGSFRPFQAGDLQPGLWVDYREIAPAHCFVLRPPALAVGLGGHRGVGRDELEELLRETFKEENLSLLAIKALATIDRRAQEPGFQDLAAKLGRPMWAYRPEELAQIPTPNPSGLVRKNIGVDSVCEAAAILAAQRGPLLVPKHKSRRCTCAVALGAWTSSAWVPDMKRA
ncbi:MAG: cobalamin biosynthesis protein [Deltaproteobacteria bacterium]|jgi:cobalt-precorrin 5A hydrolase|nr:cobalamin biosynthesis protein [Deltaproteobacteria bacterium]